MFEDLRLKNVNTGVNGVAEGLFDLGFLLEAGDAVIGVGHHDPVAAHLFPGDPFGHETGNGPFLPVATNRFAQIKVDQGIAAQHHEGVVEEMLKVLDLFQPSG